VCNQLNQPDYSELIKLFERCVKGIEEALTVPNLDDELKAYLENVKELATELIDALLADPSVPSDFKEKLQKSNDEIKRELDQQ
jgi:hypothetical protein